MLPTAPALAFHTATWAKSASGHLPPATYLPTYHLLAIAYSSLLSAFHTTGCMLLTISYCVLVTTSRNLFTRTNHYLLLTRSNLLSRPTTCYFPITTYVSLLTTYYLLITRNRQLLITFYFLLSTYCSLISTCYLPLATDY